MAWEDIDSAGTRLFSPLQANANSKSWEQDADFRQVRIVRWANDVPGGMPDLNAKNVGARHSSLDCVLTGRGRIYLK